MKKPLIITIVVAVLAVGSGALGWYLGKRGPRISGPKVKSYHVDSLARVPASAVGLTSFDLGWMLEMTIEHDWGLFKTTGNAGELKKALTEASETYLGFDVLDAEKAVIWVSGLPSPGVAVRVDGGFDGAIKGKESEQHAGVDVVRMRSGAWGALVDGALIVGTRDAVKDGIDASRDAAKSLEKDAAAFAAHTKALDAIDDGAFVTSMFAGAYRDFLPDAIAGIEAAAIALDVEGGYSFSATGSEATLKSLIDLWNQGQETAKSQVDALQAEADKSGPAAKALGLTLAKAKLADLRASIEVKHSGDVASVAAEGPGGILTLYLGVLAGVAIPAFEKYMLRAKDTERQFREREREREELMKRIEGRDPP